MKNLDFLSKLKEDGALKLIELSEEISQAYLIKSEKCIQVAKLAYDAGIFENAISEAYYSIYNTVLSLFYKCGIKCENHSGAVILIKDIFGLEDLYEVFSQFKKDRIDNQYYLPIKNFEPISKDNCIDKIKIAQRFNLDLRAFTGKITFKEINLIREKLDRC
jgi:uncharacterized protein (UPF0332 family)